MAQLTINRPAPARDVLTRAEAAARARRVSDVAYDIDVDLDRDAETYSGNTTISFALAGRDEPLFIDFKGTHVTGVLVDGRPVEADIRDHRLWLAPDLLAPRMTVSMSYRNRFDDAGDGFHRFEDPEDGEVYVYSNFEPFAAHRLFPCFDQPDIKAVYRVTATAPADWEVVSASPVAAVERAGANRRRHAFAATERFSPYLLSLIAGPYHVVRSEDGDVPLGLYGRRSLERELDREADELFLVTRQGFAYYMDLFDQPYPFAKYDQLFMPEFNIGAMENVGAVTFHDGFLYRDPATETQRLGRAEVVLHELAHMWFGDLVTMRWWDDLWLNESFATYVSFLALTEATRFTGAWRTFNGVIKRPAYRQDQLVTTHPISADAHDTTAAQLNFDDITYGKGASVLKQLVATIGRDAFRDGMRGYFGRYLWGNATLADFIGALEEAAGVDLQRWAHLWLETASLNTIEARAGVKDGRIDSLELVQTAPADYPTLRPHAMQVALVSNGRHPVSGSGKHLTLTALPATIDADRSTLRAAVGQPAPLLVFPNHEDHDYARARLDPASIAFARERLTDLDDPLMRQLLWTTVWDMVWDAVFPSTDFLAMCHRQLPNEPDLELLDSVVNRALRTLQGYLPESVRENEADAWVEDALAVIAETESTDAKLIWLRSAVAAAATPSALERLLHVADGRVTLEGVAIDQEMRWTLATKAIAFGVPDAEDRLIAERERDHTDRGARALIRAEVSRPDPQAKQEAWRRIHGEGYGSYHLTRAAMLGFIWSSQRDLAAPYREPFFESLRTVFDNQDHPFARSYLAYLIPSRWAEPEVLERGRALLGELGPEDAALERELQEELDDLSHAIRIRELAERNTAG